MNKLFYFFYTLHQRIGQFFEKRIDNSAVIRYKTENGIKLSKSEEIQILVDVDKVIYGEMKLSEYFEKRGTVYVDEKFLPLIIREREEPLRNTLGERLEKRFKNNEQRQAKGTV